MRKEFLGGNPNVNINILGSMPSHTDVTVGTNTFGDRSFAVYSSA